eukprot:325504_1
MLLLLAIRIIYHFCLVLHDIFGNIHTAFDLLWLYMASSECHGMCVVVIQFGIHFLRNNRDNIQKMCVFEGHMELLGSLIICRMDIHRVAAFCNCAIGTTE